MESGGVQIRVRDMLFVLQKRWKMILSLTLVGLVFGVLLFAMTYVQDSIRSYEASGSFAISTQNHSDGVYINGSQVANNNDFHLAEDMVDAVSYVLRSNRVLEQVIQQQGLLGTTVDELRSNLSITQYQATQIVEMRFIWRTAEEAQSIWQAIIDIANQSIPAALQLGQLIVINAPEVRQSSIAGAGKLLPVLLTMMGFCCGVGIALMELILRPKLTNPRDAETMFGLETIGIIPQDGWFFRSRQGSLLTNSGPDRSNVLQNYSAAAYILRNRLGTKEQHHCFYVTSTTSGEGKSTVAANLAVQLSDMEHRTLLIDFDTRNPSLGSLFMDKVDYIHSLNALYHGDATEEDAITPLTGCLDLLPAVLEHNAMILDGAITEMIQRLTDRYEYIIMDSAPVGEVSETLSLNRVANTVLYVIKYDSTPLPAIQNALEKLDKSGIRVLGCVVNAVGNGGSKSGEDKKSRTYVPVKPKAKKQSRKEKPKKKKKQPEPKKIEKAAPLEPTPAASVEAAPGMEKTKAKTFGLWKDKDKKDGKSRYVDKHAKGGVRTAERKQPEEKQPVPSASPNESELSPVAKASAPSAVQIEKVSSPAATEMMTPEKLIQEDPAPEISAAPLRPASARRDPLGDLAAEQAGKCCRDVLSELMEEEKTMSNEERSTQSVMDELLQQSRVDGKGRI